MTEIVKHETTAASLPQKMEWARTMAASNLLPRQYQQNPGNLLYAVEYAETLGVAPMTAVTGIHVIEGKRRHRPTHRVARAARRPQAPGLR